MIDSIVPFLPFYLGCPTTIGELIGVSEQVVFIKTTGGGIHAHDTTLHGFYPKLYLKRLSHLSEEESIWLIEAGFSIGRPKGYSFSPNAFLYLLSLRVDLFNLIDSGLALEISRTGN